MLKRNPDLLPSHTFSSLTMALLVRPTTSALVACLLLSLACNPGAAPGEGPMAEAGYKTAAPLIRALAAFHADSGAYPQRLNSLVPAYLPLDSLHPPAGWTDHRWPGYAASASGFELTFSYPGAALNTCRYQSGAGTWACARAL